MLKLKLRESYNLLQINKSDLPFPFLFSNDMQVFVGNGDNHKKVFCLLVKN